MTKKAKQRKPKKSLTRKQSSRLERERRIEKILLWSVTIVGIVVVGVLGYGLVFEKIIKAREPVAIVSDTSITTDEFQARVRFTRMQIQQNLFYLRQRQVALDPTDPNSEFMLQYIQEQMRQVQDSLSEENAGVLGEQAINQLIQEELVRQEAERRNITVTREEIQQQVEMSFGYDPNSAAPEPTVSPPVTPTGALTPTAEPLPTPTRMTQESFRQLYNNYLRESLKPLDISEERFRSWIEASLLIEKLREQMTAEVPAEADQVTLRLLSVDSAELANVLAARLDAGEDFQALADELNENEAGYSDETGWLPRDLLEEYFGAEIADLAFSLEVGERSQPLALQEGQQYAIIEATGHEERGIDQWVQQQLVEDAFRTWLEAQQFLVERRAYSDRVPTTP